MMSPIKFGFLVFGGIAVFVILFFSPIIYVSNLVEERGEFCMEKEGADSWIVKTLSSGFTCLYLEDGFEKQRLYKWEEFEAWKARR